MEDKINKVLEKLPEARQSYFQMKHFIIGKEVTKQSQMWQCLRELEGKKKTLDSANLQIEDLQDEIELLDIKRAELELNKEKKEINNELDKLKEILKEKESVIILKKINRRKKSLNNSISELQNTIKYCLQEANFYLKTFEELEKFEALKDYDDLDVQKEYWNAKISQKIHMKLLLSQPVDVDLVETALSLHEDAPIRIQMEKTIDKLSERLSKNIRNEGE